MGGGGRVGGCISLIMMAKRELHCGSLSELDQGISSITDFIHVHGEGLCIRRCNQERISHNDRPIIAWALGLGSNSSSH